MALTKIFKNFETREIFNNVKVSASKNNNIYRLGGIGVQVLGAPEILWNDICFISDAKLIWTHGELYNCDDIDLTNYITNEKLTSEINKIDLSKYLLRTEFEDSVDITNLVTKGAVATINGESIINGGNIEIDSSIYKVVTTLPTENIYLDKIYLTKAASSTSTTTDFECWKYEDGNWVDLGPFGSVKIDLSAYLSKAEADQRYMVKSSNVNSSLIVLDNGQVNNMGDNGQAFNGIRDVSNAKPVSYNGASGSGFPLNCASFGVKNNGTTAFSHKKYDTYIYNKVTNTASASGARNTAVLVFSGKSGLLYAKNTGTGADVTDAMYKYVGVIDSPDENQRCYSAKQVDGITNALSQRINELESQNEYLMNVIGVLMDKLGIDPSELNSDGTAMQSLSDIDDDINTNISNNTIDYSDRSNEPSGNDSDV